VRLRGERPDLDDIAQSCAIARKPTGNATAAYRGTDERQVCGGTRRTRIELSAAPGALDPATRARIEASLAVIRSAHEDIRKALAGDPGSPVLEQLWQSTWHDELDLYDHVVRATQPTMTRT
jgi:hypothetical protein